jgi:tRNA 2-thiouridine synthesizing protein E
MSYEINEKIIETDGDGFLSNPYEWEPAVAETMADVDGVTLTDAHWSIIRFLRDYYDVYEVAPDLRTLSKVLGRALGADKGNKEQLTALFSQSPAVTACQYAGLPKPIKGACV